MDRDEKNDNTQRRRVVVRGRVQGVGFRRYARDRAWDLGLSGWVRNLPDGSVEICFQGDPECVLDMEEWCRKGSPFANVRSIEISEELALACESEFDIR
jgi:acylphosphatase